MAIAGYRDGYFNDEGFDSVVAEVEEASPDIVFVGITSPKKERLIERFPRAGRQGRVRGRGRVVRRCVGQHPPCAHVDAARHLEWLFRMMQEPKRLVKRYVVGNTRFYLLLRKEAKRGKANG